MTTTPDRLRQATATLLAQRPAATVTLRDITSAAGANVAAVGYHFGSKDALVAEVVGAAIEATTAGQRAALEALPAEASLVDVVRAWLGPALVAGGSAAAEPSWRVLRYQLGDTTPAVREVIGGAFDHVGTVLIDRLRPHLPHLGDDELRLRHLAVLATLGGLTTMLSARPDPGAAAGAGVLPGPAADHIVAFLIGGLTAPAALPHQRHD